MPKASPPSNETIDPIILELDEQAWSYRYRDNPKGHAAADQMIALAPPDTRGAALGYLHKAVYCVSDGDYDVCREMRNRAVAILERVGAIEDWRTVHFIDAINLRREGRADAAVRLLLELPFDESSPHGQLQTYQALNILGTCSSDLGDLDQALRYLLQALAVAQRCGYPAAEANARANLGGFQYDALSLDDARQNLERAVAICEALPAPLVWFTAAVNLMLVLDALTLHEKARELADAMLTKSDRMPRHKRHSFFTKFAAVYLHCGDVDKAGALLLDAADAHAQARNKIEYVWVESEYHNARGNHAAAKAAADAKIQGLRPDTEADMPFDAMQLYRAATVACEALGDHATALQHHRRAFALYETLVGMSARARRITLEVEHDLERTAWQRDDALRRQRDAEAERHKLAELNRALENTNLAKTRFLAAASHDLRQPVHALGLYADTLARRVHGDAEAELVRRIQVSAQSIHALLSDLLDITKLDTGTLPQKNEPISVAELLLKLEHEFADTAHARGLELRLRGPDVWVMCDPVLLMRIMQNLVSNAITYTRHGGVLICARACGDSVRLEVWDTGIGIAAEHVPHIFEEFYQIDNFARDRRKGLGLGLAIVQRLTRLLGVAIDLASRPGRGTRVRVRLRRTAPITAPAWLEPSGPGLPAGLKVLIVDDNDEVRNAVSLLLQGAGATVEAARSVAEAVDWASRRTFACAVVDWRLPDGDGLAALAAMRRAHGQALPALIVTGDAAAPDIIRFKQMGEPWLIKPIAAHQLLEAIAALVRGSHSLANHAA